ncbi:DUF411 domain-containing protein [Azonexus sp.]|uniref:DUF411 domain-containing protein n=1 Tax=Azonexus sp. TaxID=1872668 RepID=UPI0039E5E0C9
MQMQKTRRSFLLAALALPCSGLVLAARAQIAVEVWKSPHCGCCGDWVAHLEANGFKVTVHAVDDLDAQRRRLGMPQRYASCHTAKVGAYLLEGHVPAADIQRLLREQPRAVGLAVPGMPVGSPGMDGPAYGGRKDVYTVLLVEQGGGARAFTHY